MLKNDDFLFIQLKFNDPGTELVHYIQIKDLENYFLKFPVDQEYIKNHQLSEMVIQYKSFLKEGDA